MCRGDEKEKEKEKEEQKEHSEEEAPSESVAMSTDEPKEATNGTESTPEKKGWLNTYIHVGLLFLILTNMHHYNFGKP